MKRLCLLAVLLLVGCDGSKNTLRQTVIDKYNTTEVAEVPTSGTSYTYIIRDTNGAIWTSDVSYDSDNYKYYIKSSTLIFSSQK